MLLNTPDIYTMVSGDSEGISKLNAFDIAILNAGVGNTNLIKLSSILPPNTKFVSKINYNRGSLVPIAYGSIVSDKKNEIIAASVAIAITEEDGFGVIMEYSGICSADEAKAIVSKMAEDAIKYRKMVLKEIKSIAIEHKVENIGCAFCGVPMWYSEKL
ncbi:MAG: arginine decarboxylase, pyruvoyl-dependent [Candidatus Acididesulfobacter diazotrophicus]|jgi:arginine decarboxylase|uniref:Pyruvoyl-dependent arginine decarboxylase AaxB n=1 Tax=Candidatus Acididesulfobacter diazotrophicus TaxID=2597226 RepID=A0A519BP52_9DELT|nr:MAG: arginine decarboxylase, pyruvoyl-dependent [Candidatus Acididesulfobacter diazotrophicus]